jgi:hypothetical protein
VTNPSNNWLADSGNGNLPFDPKMTSYYTVGTEDSRGQGPSNQVVDVRRGYVRTDERLLDSYARAVGRQYLFFLFNPGGISTSYSMQAENPQMAKLFQASGSAGEATPLVTSLTQTLSFSLLFDRTYEVRQGSTEGAWRDVRAALAMAGVMQGSDASAIYTSGSDFAVGAMAMRAMYFHFGNQAGGLTYYGYLTNLSIEYTNFSRAMIPIRVGMRLDAVLLPNNEPQQSGEVADANIVGHGYPGAQSSTERGFPGAQNLSDKTYNTNTGDFNPGEFQTPDYNYWQ